MKQRNDTYYFLFAICAAIFVCFLFTNFAGVDNEVAEIIPPQTQFQDFNVASESELGINKDLSSTIRKIADSNTLGSNLIPQAKPKMRQPAMAGPGPGSESESPAGSEF